VDYAADKQGPALLAPSCPANVKFATNLRWHKTPPLYFTPGKGNGIEAHCVMNEEPYLLNTSHENAGAFNLAIAWDVDNFPYLSCQLQRPTKDDNSKVYLQLHTTSHGIFTVPLVAAENGPNYLALPQPLKWEAGKWTALTLDIKTLIRSKLGNGAPAQLIINQVAITRTQAGAGVPLYLKDFYLYAPWRPQDAVKLDAYDASGLGGLDWEYTQDGQVLKKGAQAELSIAPRTLELPAAANGWLDVYVKDKAGNRAVPLHFPVPSP